MHSYAQAKLGRTRAAAAGGGAGALDNGAATRRCGCKAEGAAAGEDAAAGKKRKELEAEIEAQLEAAEAEEGVLHASLRKLKSTEKRALLQQEIRCRTLQLELITTTAPVFLTR